MKALPAGVIVLSAVVELLTPSAVSSAPLLAAAPVAAASLMEPLGIVVTGVCAVLVQAALMAVEAAASWTSETSDEVTLAAVTGLALLIRRTLRGQRRRMLHAQHIAAMTQQAVLPAPPARFEELRIAARYLPADADTLVGGDLYAAQETPYGLRILIGDVRGKGLSAIESVSTNLGAFRHAADEVPDLPALARELEVAIEREDTRRGGLSQTEGFTTALLAEIPRSCHLVRTLNRGHPPPLLLSGGTARPLTPSQEAPPLGMTALGCWKAPVDTHAFPPGSTLLCYTDGTTEARAPSGVFYEPVSRLPVLLRTRRMSGLPTPKRVLDLLVRDVLRHTHGVIADDQALLALHRTDEQPGGAS